MKVIKEQSDFIDIGKRHTIEFSNAELIIIVAAIGKVSSEDLNRELADSTFFTRDFSKLNESYIYDDLLELLKKENIVREDF